MNSQSTSLRRFYNQIGPWNPLGEEELNELLARAQQGDAHAYNKVIKINQRLVAHIARSYLRPYVDIMDLIQEGNIGLMKACAKFEPERGVAFSTYAVIWVKAHIRRYVLFRSEWGNRSSGNIQLAIVLNREENRYRARFGHDPTDEEMAEFLGVDTNAIPAIRENKVKLVSPAAFGGNSDNHDDGLLLDNLSDNDSPSPLEQVLGMEDAQRCEEIVAMIREKFGEYYHRTYQGNRDNLERDVEIYLMRLQGKKLQEIGDIYGITRERVRQIEKRAGRVVRRIVVNNRLLEPAFLT